MSSSTKSTDEYFFAGSGVVVVPVGSERDPFEVLGDLMVVVEELCPTWPPREPFEHAVRLRLWTIESADRDIVLRRLGRWFTRFMQSDTPAPG